MLRFLAVALLVAAPLRADDLHAPFDAILTRYVDDNGRVAYRDLGARDGAALDAYLQSLATANPDALSEPEQIAFWLNAYNAHVLRGVLDGYSAEGVIGRKRFFSFYDFPLAGKTRTLDDVENGILRARFHEPRIHFALVCASTSCPKLRREAYRGERLDAQLDDQTRGFLTDPTRNQFGPGESARVSMIFKWFQGDFDAAAGSVPAFIGRWVPFQFKTLSYLGYDWTMNAQPGQRPE
ncbi:MAG TPA: DUF547 domain-containing protein [Candidatus Dormibacteraeota bacterium]|nr:DUF547 domain-containing protein [Candidatus Dormibacteraeota bacterium]